MNPFEAVAERQVSAPIKRLHARIEKKLVNSDRDAPMVGTLQEREQQKQAKQFRWYQVYLREQRDLLLNGPYGREARGLLELLKSLTPESAPALVKYMAASQWPAAPRKIRCEILKWCDTAISDLRIVHGLAPFDDGLMDEPLPAYVLLRAVLEPDRHDP